MTLIQILSRMHSFKTQMKFDSSDYYLMWNSSWKLIHVDIRSACVQLCYFSYSQSKGARKWSGVCEKMLLPCTVKSIMPKQVTLQLPLSTCNITDIRLKVSDNIIMEPHCNRKAPHYEDIFRSHGFNNF